MSDKSSDHPVRIIGSRELHQALPRILEDLEQQNARYVLTVHGRPKAVLIGGAAFLDLVSDHNATASEATVCLQLTAMLGPRSQKNAPPLEAIEKALNAPSPPDGAENGQPGPSSSSSKPRRNKPAADSKKTKPNSNSDPNAG